MRIPKTPPDVDKLMAEWIKNNIDRYVEIFLSKIHNDPQEKYYHWDKLSYYPSPNDLNHEEWWVRLKEQRRKLYRQIPLNDIDENPFQFLINDSILEQLHKIDQEAGGIIRMPEQITNPETKDQYYIRSLTEEAITSSQLEGAATTRRVAKEMIRAGRPPRDISEQMIVNNYHTMKHIGKIKNKKLSKSLILEIHRLVTSQTLDEPTGAGRFRNSNEKRVVGNDFGDVFHDPPSSQELDHRMKMMCDFANGKIPGFFVHPVIRSIILHFWLAYDHPFVDGNGRTARALFYWSMLHHGFWLFEFVSISQIIHKAPSQYGRAFLLTETDDNDLTYFILYHLHVVKRAIKELHTYINYKTKQLRATEAQLRGIETLNHRQRTLIIHALRHPNFRYTVESHRSSHNIVHQTSRTDLYGLVRKKLLKTYKIGRTWQYTPVENLEDVLQKLSINNL